MLPAGVQWEGLRLKAELEVKGVRYPVRWACRQKVNSDGSLTLRHITTPISRWCRGVMNMNFSTLFILLACVSAAMGQTPNSSFYVATTGNDSNLGTQSAPWRTIQHAADTARAGSTVSVGEESTRNW